MRHSLIVLSILAFFSTAASAQPINVPGPNSGASASYCAMFPASYSCRGRIVDLRPNSGPQGASEQSLPNPYQIWQAEQSGRRCGIYDTDCVEVTSSGVVVVTP